jgi:lysophospholipase L1-like esterase
VPLKGPGKRSAAALVLLPLIMLVSIWAVRASAGADPKSKYYVSLGDSLARGWQPDADGHSRETTEGYVDVVADGLQRNRPGLRSVKLGCAGETTVSITDGGTCSYPAGSELAQAEAFLRSHRGEVAAVTVNIGDNDVEQCLLHSRIDTACVTNQLAIVRARLPGIASRLRAAAGEDVRIVGMTDYDQFLAYWLDGPDGQRLARQSMQVVDDLNRTVNAIYTRAGIDVADATPAFAGTDLTHLVPLAGHGRVPVAVARVCNWTWACSNSPVGFNDHANATGYRALGQVVLTTLRAKSLP